MPRPRPGFTLLELLLVLALLVAIAAMASPLILASMERTRLESAADIVRAEWVRGRVKAMKTGRIHVFQFEIGGRRFSVEPLFADGDDLSAVDDSLVSGQNASGSSPAGALPSGGGADSQAGADHFEGLGSGLPTGVLFQSGQTISDVRSAAVDDASTGVNAPAGGAMLGGQEGEGVFFYPDGTTSTAEVVLINSRQKLLTVSMRGLTGVVRVGEVTSQGVSGSPSANY